MQISITGISRKEKVSTRTNKPFTSLGLKTQEYGDKWLSGFGNASNKDWKVGDTVEVEIEQKGEYLNFTTPKNANGTEKPSATTSADIAWIKNALSTQVIPMLKKLSDTEVDDYPVGTGEPNFDA